MSARGSAEIARPIVFLDDAHTFGGAQIALGWAILAVLRHCPQPVICICTAATRDKIRQFTGDDAKLTFVECAPALPLNIFSFPLRLWSFYRLLAPLAKQGIRDWWLNLAGIEFCLAGLLALRWFGIRAAGWLHNSETFLFYTANSSVPRKALSRLRDALANRFLFSLYLLLVTPSHATEKSLRARFRCSNPPHTGFLYPTVGLRSAPRAVEPEVASTAAIQLWMISRVEFIHKNNLAGLQVLGRLRLEGKAAHLTIVGDGPDMKKFVNATKEMGLADSVSFRGWENDPWSAVPKGAIILIPSFFEAMPLVATEAMLRGVRMVASPIPAFHEGSPKELIARDFSAEALTEKVCEVSLMSGDHIRELYTQALTKFTEEAFVAKFQSFLAVSGKKTWAAETSLGREAV